MSSRIKLWSHTKLGAQKNLVSSNKMTATVRFTAAALLSLAVGGMMLGSGTQAFAADKKKAAAKEKNAWIKICDEVKLKEVKAKKASSKKICMTHHESLSARTGTPLVSAAVRNVSGHKVERFLVTVPLGMAIPAGVHIKVDEGKPLKIKYSFCHVAGCVAETQMTPDLMKQMKGGKKIVIATIGISGKPIGFPIPLNGFGKAYAGKPIDSKKYANARKAMMLDIRKRQIKAAKKAQAKKDAELIKNADNPRKK